MLLYNLEFFKAECEAVASYWRGFDPQAITDFWEMYIAGGEL